MDSYSPPLLTPNPRAWHVWARVRTEKMPCTVSRDLTKAHVRIAMNDGTRWDVPVMTIARHRAENYKCEFGGDVERSLNEDTLPLFAADENDLHDWRTNNMNWDDVSADAVRAESKPRPAPDYQDGWVNGTHVLVGGF